MYRPGWTERPGPAGLLERWAEGGEMKGVELYKSIRRAVHVVGDEWTGGGVAVWERPADTGANVIVQKSLPTSEVGRSRRILWRLILRGGTSSASRQTRSVLADHDLRLDNDDRVQR